MRCYFDDSISETKGRRKDFCICSMFSLVLFAKAEFGSDSKA